MVAMVTTYTPLDRSQVFKMCPKCPADTGTLRTRKITNEIAGKLSTTRHVLPIQTRVRSVDVRQKSCSGQLLPNLTQRDEVS